MSTYINSLNQAATASATNQTNSATAADSREDILGKQEFLTLLVAQMQNQDPLNPDEPTEFTAQLAQYSSLEQLFNLNDSMDGLVQAYQSADKMSTLSTIGKEVAYNSASFEYTGDPIVLGYQLDGQASEVSLTLKKDGATIATLEGDELSAGTHYLTWDGISNTGQEAAQGSYQIVLQAKAGEGQSVAASPVIRSEVTGVDLEGENGGTLITKVGEVNFNSILGIYDPGTTTGSTNSDNESEENVNTETVAADIEESTDNEQSAEDTTQDLTS